MPAKVLLICSLKLPSEVVASSPSGGKVCACPDAMKSTRAQNVEASRRLTRVSSCAFQIAMQAHERRADNKRESMGGGVKASTPELLFCETVLVREGANLGRETPTMG